MKRKRVTPKPEPVEPAVGEAWTGKERAEIIDPVLEVVRVEADPTHQLDPLDFSSTYKVLARHAGADPGQAVVVCADGTTRLLERAVIKTPKPFDEAQANGDTVDVNNYEPLWLSYDERNYDERTYRGLPYPNNGAHPDVPLYTVTNKNTARNKPAWWKESQ